MRMQLATAENSGLIKHTKKAEVNITKGYVGGESK